MRSTFLVTALLTLTTAAACGADGDDGPTTPEILDGFAPRAPGPDELQVVGPIVRDIAPGADVTLCSYLPLDRAFPDTLDVVGAEGFQSHLAAHHAVLYLVERERPVDTHECNDDDMINARYLAGAGGGDVGGSVDYIPEGVAYRIDAGRQLMVQSHWINATTAPVDGQAVFDLTVRTPSTDVELAQLFTWTSTQIDVPANATGSAHTDCVVQQEMQFFRIGGHAHEWGTQVSLSYTPAGGSPEVFYDEPWESYMAFDPPRLDFARAEAMVVHPGDTLSIDCAYANDTGDALGFPKEMCTGFGFYFPGTAQLDCTDGNWPE